MVSERRLIARPHEVAGFLNGTQTQFRRVVKPQPVSSANVGGGLTWGHEKLGGLFAESVFPGCFVKLVPCPYGQPGDRLWVPEAWRITTKDNHPTLGYRFGEQCVPGYHGTRCVGGLMLSWAELKRCDDCWRSPIHMPRWASRITLEVVAVRVDRLQAISEADAMAEGITRGMFGGFVAPGVPLVCADGNRGIDLPIWKSPKDAIAASWDHINGKSHPWESNPWVWVVEFRKAATT